MQGSTIADVALSLTRHLDIQNGTVELGPLPGTTSPETVLASMALDDDSLDPNGTVRLSFDIEDPEGDVPETTLMQFESSDEHIEVPTPASHVELEINIDASVCDGLCNVEHHIQLMVAVLLENGDVSDHATIELSLDCGDHGSADACVTIDEQGEEVSSSPSGRPGTGSSSGTTGMNVPSGVDLDTGCSNAVNSCRTVFEPNKPMSAGEGGPRTVAECTSGFGCLFDNADDGACTDILTEILSCLEQMGEGCLGCSPLIEEMDTSGVCSAADTACFGHNEPPDPGTADAGPGSTDGGSSAQGACGTVPLDKLVSEFTEAEASASCLCGYEQMPDVDAVQLECLGRAVFAAQSQTECEAMVAACVAGDPMLCNGAEQLGFISGCSGTLRELQGCFQEAAAWQWSLTCADAGPENEARRSAGTPQCLVTACNLMR